jgi:glyceraldehyde-3-phosphate dehydrogenase (NADP+)
MKTMMKPAFSGQDFLPGQTGLTSTTGTAKTSLSFLKNAFDNKAFKNNVFFAKDHLTLSPSSIRFGNTNFAMFEPNSVFKTANEIPAEFATVIPYDGGSNYLIGGEVKQWTGEFMPVNCAVQVKGSYEGLSTLAVGKLPKMTSAEGAAALDAATKAYGKGGGQWPMMSHSQRIQCLETFISKMIPQRELVAKLEMFEIGKSYEDCLSEFDRTVDYMKKSIEALKKLDTEWGQVVELEGTLKKETRTAKGVAMCFGPYNYPLNEAFAGMIPALLMGNTIIAKLPKMGGLCTTPLLKAFQESFPAGVVNYLSCAPEDDKNVIGPIMQSGKVDILSFIGGENGANAIEKSHPKPNRLTSVLGLGAKNPGIILPDANMDLVVKEAVTGALSFNGQRCTALKILFVPKSREKEFCDKFTVAVNGLKKGMPWEKGVKITPLPNAGTVQYMQSLVQDAVSKGATILNEDQGGGSSAGNFYTPAVVSGITPGMQLYHTEQFGPVVPIVTYNDISEVVNYVENSEVGQQAAIFGQNPAGINALVREFKNQFSRVNINSQCKRSPDEFAFDGRKNSAKGTLSITDALKIFSGPNMITLKAGDEGRQILSQLSFDE